MVDTNGRPVQGVTVDWSKNQGVNASLAGNTSTTNEKGEATMEVTGTAAETAKFGARVGANTSDTGKEADAVFTLYPVVGVTVTKDNVSADGTTAGTVEVTVADLAGAPVTGQAVTIATASGVMATSTGMTDADGKLSVDVTSTVSGTTGVTASVGAGNRQEATAQLNFGRYVRFDGLTLIHTPPTTDATNAGKICQADCDITLTAKVVDVSGNAVPDVSVSFQGSVTGNDGSVVTSGADGMVSVTRKYDKGGVEDVSLVASSQGATIGTSETKNIDILYTITRNDIHAKPTGPMLRSSLQFMGPKTPVNSYPTDLDPELAKVGSYRCTATATYEWAGKNLPKGSSPFKVVVVAEGRTNGTVCEMQEGTPQPAFDISGRILNGAESNPANSAVYWPQSGCQTNVETGRFCFTYVNDRGEVSDVWDGSGVQMVSQSAIPPGYPDNNYMGPVAQRVQKYWMGEPGALKVTVVPGTVDAAGVAVNGPLFTDIP
ncbi:hypothetical protein C9G23_25540 [Salmonella enterica]|nr:hypothetical protein [Salmonella enterica]